jgi:hypothetical protein
MTASTAPTTTRGRWIGLVLVALAVLAGAAAGAYLDWMMWHPSSGIVVTFGAIGILLVGAIAWASRWRPIRPLALGTVTFGVGVILGQNLGPSRPPISMVQGTVTIELTEPANAAPITGRADCQITPDGDNFEISGDPNLRIQIGDQPREEQDALQVAVTRGDMWEYGAEPRDDRWSMLAIVSDSGPFTDDQMPTSAAMASDASSELAVSGDQRAGSITFSGLAPTDVGLGDQTADPMDLAGKLSWSCDGPDADPEG